MVRGAPVELSLKDAAAQARCSRSTLLRMARSGRISARRTDSGAFVIDASELARLFPALDPDAPRDARQAHAMKKDASVDDADWRIRAVAAEAELKAARELIEAARRREQDLREERDQWREAALRLALPKPQEPAPAVPARRWWWSRRGA
jgi:hypothetical protein